ncbi:hypothetical protein CPLU01_13787 [Colletotrichum plurivorum]|uniref:Uncharacterized protein n=1 Tax=Colletotrichum plurivorum TaxID=2175906 RepID=A0A8H6JP43_9PEZI|nr:hypothetical protein CPLU01_13787 [Colletotrichum plurivorum]
MSGNLGVTDPSALSINPGTQPTISATGSYTSINTPSIDQELETNPFDESQPLNKPESVTNPAEVSADSQSTESSQSNESKWQTWWLEILSSLLALGSIIAIVIILSLHEGKPLPRWPALISVNSLVAVFTAIFKASVVMPVAEGISQLKWDWFRRPKKLSDVVLFDDASRGPWGSLLLIAKKLTRPREAYLPILGAFITVAALAIDPISQAMIEHRGCLLPVEPWSADVAEVSRTNYYLGSFTDFTANLVGLKADHAMEKALDRGLHYPQETADLVNFKCATGNCTFQQGGEGSSWFSSLAVCHSCRDITDRVILETVPGRESGYDNRTWWLPTHLPEFYSELNLTAPVKTLELYKTVEVKTWGKTSKVIVNPRFWIDSWPDKPFYALDVLMVSNPTCQDCRSTSPDNMAIAVRCNLDPCVRGYHAEVKNGVYSESEDKKPPQFLKDSSNAEEEDEDEDHPGDRHTKGWVLVTNTSLVDGQERPCVATQHWEPESVRVDFYANRSLGISQFSFTARESKPYSKFYRQECVWTMDATTWGALGFSLDKLLRAEGNGTFNNKIGMVEGPMWLKEMYASGSGNMSTVETMVRGLASAMTAAIRNKPYGNLSTKVEAALQPSLARSRGTVSSMQTCVSVHWGWIAYPVLLLVLQWIFSVLVSTRRHSGAAWKSSPLALLFHGLDDDLRKKHRHLDTVKDMDQSAEGIDVQLAPSGDPRSKDWRLCET